jgi:hypothetical protein
VFSGSAKAGHGAHGAHVCSHCEWPAPRQQGRIPEAGVGKMGALQCAMQFIMQCIRGAAPGTRSA